MAIANRFKSYLDEQHIPYETLSHPHSSSAIGTAVAAGIPMNQLTKTVVFRDENDHYLMAVVPSTRRAEPGKLAKLTNHQLALAEERELAGLFSDCELGAVPPAGKAYAMPMVWDDSLGEENEVYVEAGDHEHVLKLSRDAFAQLMGASPHGAFSHMEVHSQ